VQIIFIRINLKKNNMNKEKLNLIIEAAFEAGRWLGQVDLEEHMDREQYSQCIVESIFSKKINMPMQPPSTGRTVMYNLRSDKWREGVKKSCREYLKKFRNLND
jgi:hypothetical protein